MNNRQNAGGEMAKLRKEKKLTQAGLAQLLGVSQRMVAACELGERRPSADLAQRIGQALGIPWTRFFEDGKSDDVDGFDGGTDGTV